MVTPNLFDHITKVKKRETLLLVLTFALPPLPTEWKSGLNPYADFIMQIVILGNSDSWSVGKSENTMVILLVIMDVPKI